MKTRLSLILFVCAAIACATMFSGCSKGSMYTHRGEEIRFMTTSRGSLTTKTSYGDTDKGKQALNWELNDVITIASPEAVVQNDNSGAHASNYVVTGSTPGVPSTATVANEGSNGLKWGADGTYHFYSVYPKTRTDLTLNPSDGEVSATIPASQPLYGTATNKVVGEGATAITYKEYKPDMSYAYMTAAATSAETDAPVSLTFDPAFTAFEFNVSSQEDEIILTEFELVSPTGSDKISGGFTMTAGDPKLADPEETTVKAADDATSSIKVDMSSATQTVDATTGLTFTVFALPIQNTKALRLRFTSQDGENALKTSWIDMKYSENTEAGTNAGKPLVFEAGHKYRINMLKLPSSQWKITIAPIFEDWTDANEEVVIYI